MMFEMSSTEAIYSSQIGGALFFDALEGSPARSRRDHGALQPERR